VQLCPVVPSASAAALTPEEQTAIAAQITKRFGPAPLVTVVVLDPLLGSTTFCTSVFAFSLFTQFLQPFGCEHRSMGYQHSTLRVRAQIHQVHFPSKFECFVYGFHLQFQ
jgi:hypothetical protein